MPLSNLKQVFTEIRLEDVDLSKTSAMKVRGVILGYFFPFSFLCMIFFPQKGSVQVFVKM